MQGVFLVEGSEAPHMVGKTHLGVKAAHLIALVVYELIGLSVTLSHVFDNSQSFYKTGFTRRENSGHIAVDGIDIGLVYRYIFAHKVSEIFDYLFTEPEEYIYAVAP